MTSCNWIKQLLDEPDKERLTVEFKQSEYLKNGDGHRKLAYEIVALANRRGGKLLVGITDGGAFEGKGIFDVERDKGIIDNICANKISPPVEYDVELVQCDEGDVLVVEVSKRRGIPHAFIVSRKGPEIKNRVYYIRTAYGKRLLTDQQLAWLFQHQEDPDFSYRFGIVLDFDRDSLRPPFSDSLYVKSPPYDWAYSVFVQSLSGEALASLKEDIGRVVNLFRELTPYALLESFSRLFGMSWLVEIDKGSEMMSISQMDSSIPKKKISVDDIPLPGPGSVLSSTALDVREILRKFFHGTDGPGFFVPEGTELTIGTDQLEFKHQDFDIEISLHGGSGGRGPHPSSPYWPLLVGEQIPDLKVLQSQPLDHVAIECQLLVRFGFPERDMQNFHHYFHYAKIIEDHLRHNWNWGTFRERMPRPEVYSMTKKLDEILAHIKTSK